MEIKIPEQNVLQILIDKDGKIFMSLDKQEDRVATLQQVGEKYGITFTPEEINTFRLSNSFGVPIKNMKEFLNLKPEQQDQILKNYGIPNDTINKEFQTWVSTATELNKDLIIAIKADANTPYKNIKGVMNSLADIRKLRYNLITSLKNLPPEI